MPVLTESLIEEEKLVAELELLGVAYLSRQSSWQVDQVRSPEFLIADLIRQPHARVREVVIAVLLAYPSYADAVLKTIDCLSYSEQTTLRFFYTAAMLLQREYAEQLRPFVQSRWVWLPDLFSVELGLTTSGAPRERLMGLAQKHREVSGINLNWAGTYENIVTKLLRSWRLASR